jgi:hypothetical protein
MGDFPVFERQMVHVHLAGSGTVDSRSEYSLILKTLFPQKLHNASFTNPTSIVGL